jgi:hypothetical protein
MLKFFQGLFAHLALSPLVEVSKWSGKTILKVGALGVVALLVKGHLLRRLNHDYIATVYAGRRMHERFIVRLKQRITGVSGTLTSMADPTRCFEFSGTFRHGYLVASADLLDATGQAIEFAGFTLHIDDRGRLSGHMTNGKSRKFVWEPLTHNGAASGFELPKLTA